nr:putative phage tail assembly chaperone [uncultured Mediterranean phage uvMED]
MGGAAQGGGGELLTFPLSPELFCFRKHNFSMRQLDRLLEVAARNNKLTKKVVELDGEDFTFWHKPLTIAEYQAAKTSSKNPEDALENAIRLFVKKALDEAGQPQYQADAIPVLSRVLPLEFASKLIGAMQNEEEEEEVELDMKSSQAAAKKGKPSAG